MSTVKVLLFANLRIKAGIKELRIDIDKDTTIHELLEVLLSNYPMLKPHMTEKIVISVNHKIADRTDVVPDGAEVAILPPVGGG